MSVHCFFGHTMGSFHGDKFQMFMYGVAFSLFWRNFYIHLFEFNGNSKVEFCSTKHGKVGKLHKRHAVYGVTRLCN
jgi:hypothetical protein